MRDVGAHPDRIRSAWAGRVSGCMLGKPLEVLSFEQGRAGVAAYLRDADAWPLQDYIPLLPGSLVEERAAACCRGQMHRAEPDDDIAYTVIALLLLERHGADFDVADVARMWLRLLPAGQTWTAERSAYRTLLNEMHDEFVNGAAPGFDLAMCADNPFSDWIGAQIRADLYGWVCPGQPRRAASLARRDASLSHRGVGCHGAEFVAALGAALGGDGAPADIDRAIHVALAEIPKDSEVAAAVRFGRSVANKAAAVDELERAYGGLPPVHTLNNLAVVVWSLCSAGGNFETAICNAVTAGWDTDCNGATVGGLCGIGGWEIPEKWTSPWNGRIAVDLAGQDEWSLDEAVVRTCAVERALNGENHELH